MKDRYRKRLLLGTSWAEPLGSVTSWGPLGASLEKF